MSYSKDHSRKNPLAPSRMYGMSSSANTNTTPIDNQPTITTERTTREGVEGTLTTKKVKPRQSKLPKVGMEEAYDRALKLGYRDENESFEDYVIRANKFNEGSTEESFVEDEKKQELLPMEKIDAKLIDTSSRMPSLRTIQTSVPQEGMASSMSPEKPSKIKEKRDFNFNLDKLKPKINLGNPFIKNTITNRKGQFKKKGRKTKGLFARDFQGKLKIFNR
jgi:hypothetical protein